MRRIGSIDPIIIAMVAIAAISVITVLLPKIISAQSDYTGTSWEYLQLVWANMGDEEIVITSDPAWNTEFDCITGCDPVGAIVYFDRLGADGWEIVQLESERENGVSTLIVWFKRPAE